VEIIRREYRLVTVTCEGKGVKVVECPGATLRDKERPKFT